MEGGGTLESSVVDGLIEPPGGNICCNVCGLSFTNENDMSVHMTQMHLDIAGTCRSCEKSFKSLWGYRYHMKLHERSIGLTDSNCSCQVCGKFFQSLSYLERHLRSHSSERPFLCPECGRAYKHKFALKKHSCPGKEYMS
ncbi:Zinc finger protein 236 [Mizuhopecten yessoensis]|uniref:Zinc finger protein 236 n=1 Tax=Mizuhopecten yessoensis TaxID=6573 RepID=A0A210Q3E4_MIZYE|nr:Zinc finger protein 236 [Mizuhopecten yessoensis]